MSINITVNIDSFDNGLYKSALFKILNKYGIENLSVQEKEAAKGLSANNASRAAFVHFCKKNGFKRLGAKNAFEFEGKVYGFSTVKGQVPECRQFGEHYAGLVCNFRDGRTKWYTREQLNVGDVTRIGPDGVKYFNVEGEI